MIELFNIIESYMSEPIRFITDRWQITYITLAIFFISFAISWFFEEICIVKTDEYYIKIAKERLEKENKKWKN